MAVDLFAKGKIKVVDRSRADLLASLSALGVEEGVAKRVVEKPVQVFFCSFVGFQQEFAF